MHVIQDFKSKRTIFVPQMQPELGSLRMNTIKTWIYHTCIQHWMQSKTVDELKKNTEKKRGRETVMLFRFTNVLLVVTLIILWVISNI